VGDCNCEANFGMSRQMIPRLTARVKELAKGTPIFGRKKA
jgi:hypothetical protein